MADPKTALMVTPADLVAKSIDAGGSVESLQVLLDMQLRWEAAEARKAYHSAMARFKAACPPVLAKDRTVAFGKTRYTHTSLGAAIAAVTPYLSSEGLSATWESSQGERTVSVTCIVSHEQGHAERTTLTGPLDSSGQKNSIQQLGSSVTYLQRYTLLQALGLATAEQDDDAVAMHQPPPSRPAPRPEPLPAEPAPDAPTSLLARLRAAETLEELDALAQEGAAVPQGPEREQLRRAWAEADKAIRLAMAADAEDMNG